MLADIPGVAAAATAPAMAMPASSVPVLELVDGCGGVAGAPYSVPSPGPAALMVAVSTGAVTEISEGPASPAGLARPMVEVGCRDTLRSLAAQYLGSASKSASLRFSDRPEGGGSGSSRLMWDGALW